MTIYSVPPETTRDAVVAALGDKVKSITVALGEVGGFRCQLPRLCRSASQ